MAEPTALHIRGVLLPEREHRDLWIRDGHVAFEPVPRAETVATGWVLPGLVDLHCHVGLAAEGEVPPHEAERQAPADRDAGVLLIRDAGSPADTRWIDDRDDLPRVIRAGRHLARTKRYLPNYGWEIEPDELVAYVEQEAQRGDGWVKLVGDWIDREIGDLGPCWPRAALDAAIRRAHEFGALGVRGVGDRGGRGDRRPEAAAIAPHGAAAGRLILAINRRAPRRRRSRPARAGGAWRDCRPRAAP